MWLNCKSVKRRKRGLLWMWFTQLTSECKQKRSAITPPRRVLSGYCLPFPNRYCRINWQMFILSLRSGNGGLPNDCGFHSSCNTAMLSSSCDTSTLLCHRRTQHMHATVGAEWELNGADGSTAYGKGRDPTPMESLFPPARHS